MKLPRLLRTVRHLRPTQVLGQLGKRLLPRADTRGLRSQLPADGQSPPIRWEPRARWLAPEGSARQAGQLLEGRLRLVGLEQECGWPPDWSSAATPKLWRYNLHTHGFLFGLAYEDARALLGDYLDRAGPGQNNEGWEPYPLSLRIMSWLPLFCGRWRAELLAEPELAARLWLELRRMLRWLEGHLETHIQANHLLENAFALCLAGACFEGPLAQRWSRRGQALLSAELEEQLLTDGAHFERSPMYHARALFGLGLLLNSADPELRSLCAERAARMAGWLGAMTHPDGGIALFNDSGLDVYPDTAALCEWLAELGVEPAAPAAAGHLQPSGYFTARNAAGDALFMDAGPIGPDHQPGHAHADFLALELSLGGRRLVVDGGNFEYEEGPRRSFARGAEGHSTVFVDGEEPLELWGCFRVGRRGLPIEVSHRAGADGGARFGAGHTGYRHLAGRPTPRRELSWQAEGVLLIEDSVAASRPRTCTSQLRIDAAWELEELAPGRTRCRLGELEGWILAAGPVTSEPSRWFPSFFRQAPATLLRQGLEAGGPTVRWAICRTPQLAGAEALLARAAGGPMGEGAP